MDKTNLPPSIFKIILTEDSTTYQWLEIYSQLVGHEGLDRMAQLTVRKNGKGLRSDNTGYKNYFDSFESIKEMHSWAKYIEHQGPMKEIDPRI